MIRIKPSSECRFDCVALGEVMLRFDPGDDRIQTARSFRVYEGGGEYNVARSLSSVFGCRTQIVTALADNAVGRLVESLIRQGGVDTSAIRWAETDGIGRESRNGIYFMERGFGLRAPLGCSDRANTAVSQLSADDIDWPQFFGASAPRWFHTGGIFAGLSETTPESALAAMRAAREAGAVVSYDLNYRDSLWSGRGGREAADRLNAELLPYADVVFGIEGFDASLAAYDEGAFRYAAEALIGRFPNIKFAATTIRQVRSASRHDLGAVCFADGSIYKAADMSDIDVLDRVGSGDAFAAGFIYGCLENSGPQAALEYGLANAALTMATAGDWSTATIAEIKRVISRGSSAAQR